MQPGTPASPRHRVYFVEQAAELLGLEQEAVRRRAARGVSLWGWSPAEEVNPTRVWLLDADAVDREAGVEPRAERGSWVELPGTTPELPAPSTPTNGLDVDVRTRLELSQREAYQEREARLVAERERAEARAEAKAEVVEALRRELEMVRAEAVRLRLAVNALAD